MHRYSEFAVSNSAFRKSLRVSTRGVPQVDALIGVSGFLGVSPAYRLVTPGIFFSFLEPVVLIDVHPFPSGIAATSAGFLFPVAGFDRNLTPCDFFSAPSGGAERNSREIARLRSSRVSFFFFLSRDVVRNAERSQCRSRLKSGSAPARDGNAHRMQMIKWRDPSILLFSFLLLAKAE